MRFALTIIVFTLFTGFSTWVTWTEGYWGFLDVPRDPWGAQVFLDLIIALWIAMSSLRREAIRLGIPYWPYLIAVPFLGSISALALMIHRRVVLRRQAEPGSA